MTAQWKKYSILLAVAPVLLWWTLGGAERQPARSAAAAPSRILLTWAGDPARTQAVTWRTGTLASSPKAQIAPFTGNPADVKAAQTVTATGVAVTLTGDQTAAHYRVQFENLNPGTKYTYRVGDGSTWSEWNVFRTASTRPEPFRFLYIGDAQNDIHSLWSRSIRSAYAAAPDARFIIHAGDLVADGYNDRQWGEWCEAISFISAMVPSLAVPGNHDLHPAPGAKTDGNPLRAPDPWRWHFVFPGNGPPGLEGQSYYLDYQGVRFISLDANVFGGKADAGPGKQVLEGQLAWLEKTLRDNPNHWTIVFQHQPVYPIARNRQAPRLQALLIPLYDKYGVDLVLAGHDHAYGRTHKLKGGKVVTEGEQGTVYAVSVSGPKMYNLTPPDAKIMAKTLENTQLYQVISIDGDRLSFDAYNITGALVDRFELRKAASKRASN